MPLSPLIIAAIIAAAGGATVGGLEMAQVGTGSPEKAQEALLRQQQAAQQQASQTSEQENQRSIAANLQSNVGGSVTNQSFANLIKQMGGYQGTIPGIQQTVLGQPTSPGLAASDQPGGLPMSGPGLAH